LARWTITEITLTLFELNYRLFSSGDRVTLYLASFLAFFFVHLTTRPSSVADFGRVGRPSTVQMNLAPKTFVAYVGLKMLKWSHLL
jgi:hypothetical protein